MKPIALVVAAACLACGLTSIAQTSAPAPPPPPPLPEAVAQLKEWRFRADRSLLDGIAARVTEARATAASRREAAALLASVLRSPAAFDAKQFACRQLVLVGAGAEVPSLAPLLSDSRLAEYALQVLLHVPGDASTSALIRAAQVAGPARLGAIAVLGQRRDRRALPTLTAIMSGGDALAAWSAAASLANIGGPDACSAVQSAYRLAPPAWRRVMAERLLACAEDCLKRGDMGLCRAILSRLEADPAASALRPALLLFAVRAMPEAAGPRLVSALRQEGSRAQRAAAQALLSLPGATAGTLLSAELPKLGPKGRALALYALAEVNGSAAASAVATLLRDPVPSVRQAAARTLGAIGGANAVAPLLDVAAAGGAEAGAARTALGSMRSSDVEPGLLAAMQTGAPARRAAALGVLGDRRSPAVKPRLLAAAASKDAPVRQAALRIIRQIGEPSLAPNLVTLMLAGPAGSRDEIAAALADVARRGQTEAERTGTLEAAAAGAKGQDLADLLGVLADVGGPGALKALRAGLRNPAPEVRRVALTRLADWPSDEPMSELLAEANGAEAQRDRTVALRGYIRMIGMDVGRKPEATVQLYRNAANLARTPADRRMVLSGLGGLPSPIALGMASEMVSDPELRAEAELALVSIGRATAGAWRSETRACMASLATSAGDDAVKAKAAAIVELIDRFGDFITAWKVSPAYTKEGVTFPAIFDEPFAPETPGAADRVPWRVMPAGGPVDQPWLMDLLAVLGGEQRVAYVVTRVQSDREQPLLLQVGSDDGPKVWWNGEVVLSHNQPRACAPDQDRATVTARQGWNTLMVKVPQNVMGWGVCVRAATPDGAAAQGLTFAVPE